MENEIVKIKASDYGLEESKAKEIESLFTPMLSKMSELETEYNDILKEEINPETCQRAKDLRLSYVKIRTGTAEIHKKAKEFYLNGGRFVDGWKNAQLFASGEKEKTLKSIEDHFENQERERIEKLRTERIELLKPYTEIEPLALGHMQQDVFDNYLAGIKLAHEQKIIAEKKAEEDRIAKEKKDTEERENQRLENIKLKEEAIERDRLAEIERKKQADILAKQKAESDKRENELREKAEVEKKERDRLAAELKEKEGKEKVEQKRKDDEEKARKAEEKKAKLAPDKVKLLNFMQAINDLPRPEVKSIEAANIAANANSLLVKVANYIKENTNKL
ncbi:MAG: hypothetical protein WC998_06785 [Candidatus Paceibacterota bacterium]|jgi:hypothetical protein